MSGAEALLLAAAAAVAAAQPSRDAVTHRFDATAPGEAIAIVRAVCQRCDWGEPGREAAALRLTVDDKYSQHLVLARGADAADYRVTLGAVAAGPHTLTIDRDPALSAPGAGPALVSVDAVAVLSTKDDDRLAQAMAPILHARANTIGRFTDLPILMWYEIVPTPRGRQFRYSVIFTNEDGGTPTDRLMATWGRTTDIEFVYGVEVDAGGRPIAEQFQGPGHEVPPFRGGHEGSHPLLWVSTDNNMVSESGSTSIRYAPAPERHDLTNASREAVMDAHPWSYHLMAAEVRREGKVADRAAPGSGAIPDPQRFAFVEACGRLDGTAIAFEVRIGDAWIASDFGIRQFRIVRDGCFRAAIPLPSPASSHDIKAVRITAADRVPADGHDSPPAPVHVTRINKLFMLDAHDLPGPSLLHWEGEAAIAPGGAPFTLPVR